MQSEASKLNLCASGTQIMRAAGCKPVGTEREPSEAVRVRRGATTKWMSPAARGEAKDTKFVATKPQQSGFRLRACQKYFFDTLCGASFGMRRSVCRAFSLTAVSFACRIVSEGGILYNAAAAAAKRSPREAGSAPGAARRSRRAVKNNKLTKGRRPYENSVQKAP